LPFYLIPFELGELNAFHRMHDLSPPAKNL
jgi:hypothetical protein